MMGRDMASCARAKRPMRKTPTTRRVPRPGCDGRLCWASKQGAWPAFRAPLPRFQLRSNRSERRRGKCAPANLSGRGDPPMISNVFTRRDFSLHVATLLTGLGIAKTGVASTDETRVEVASGNEEISHAAESIHQEIVLKASRKRVYAALTEAEQFTKVMRLSKFPDGPVAAISREAGGSFSLFGDRIVGRQLELVPNERLVQAWRAGHWETGLYSIARFELKEQGDQTKILFDHTAFPVGQAEHLLDGWNSNYWEPLRKYLV